MSARVFIITVLSSALIISFCAPVSAQQDPRTLFENGVAAAERADSPEALEKAAVLLDAALKAAQAAKDADIEARVLERLALVTERQGRLSEGIAFRERAVEAAGKSGDLKLHADTLYALGGALMLRGAYPEALAAFEKDAAIRRQMKDPSGEARALNLMGEAFKDRGLFSEAAAYFEKSLATAKAAGESSGQARAMNNLGLLAMEQGDYSNAETHFTDALKISADQTGLKERRATWVNLGHLNRERGKYAEAADYFRQALESARDGKDPDEEYLLQYNLGRLAEDWGRLKKAGEFFTQSLSLARNAGAARREVLSLTALSQVAAKEGQLDKALKDLRQAGEICARAGLPTDETDLKLGHLYLDAGKPDKAAPYVEKSGSDAALGRLSLAKGDYKKAETHYAALLEAATKSGSASDLFTAHTGLGRVFEAQKEYEKAGKHYTSAMELTEELRGGLLPSQRRNFLSIRVNGFDRAEPAKGLNRVSFKQGRPNEGVIPAELARARAFADRLAVGPEQGYAGVPESVQEREGELTARIAALKKDRSCCSRSLNPERYDNLTKKIEEAEAEQKGLIDTLWADFAPYAAVKYPRPLTPDNWAVKADEWIVVFDVLDEGVGVRVFKGKELVDSRYEKWSAADLAKSVTAFREPFDAAEPDDFDPELGRVLFKRLLAPVLAKIPKGAHLVIIADGPLAELPFEALVVGGQATWKNALWGRYPVGLTYLGDMYPVSYYQSITALTLARRAARSRDGAPRVLVIADPVFEMTDERVKGADLKLTPAEQRKLTLAGATEPEETLKLPRLKETSALAENLREIYKGNGDIHTGLKAGKSLFFSEITQGVSKYSDVVFATHGVYGGIPWINEPVLTLCMTPPGVDGLLKMTEVMSMSMNARTVALTACQTALGRHVSGEGVMSMGRAFQYAGAQSALMTLWSVEQTASVKLVENFFRHLNGGATRMAALMEARKDIRHAGYDHPFFWAAFVLSGEVD